MEGVQMSDTPISDSTPHNVADLGMQIRRIERQLNEANAIIRQQQMLEEENLRLQERIKCLEDRIDLLMSANADVARIATITRLKDRIKRLEEALNETVNWIVKMAECGDAGFWDAEEVSEIIAARAALKIKEAKL
jgi:hypothetical protein